VIVDQTLETNWIVVQLLERTIAIGRGPELMVTERRQRALDRLSHERERDERVTEQLGRAQREVSRHDPDLVATRTVPVEEMADEQCRRETREGRSTTRARPPAFRGVGAVGIDLLAREVALQADEEARTRGLLHMREEEP